MGANLKVIGNVNACTALMKGALASIKGQTLWEDSGLHVPSLIIKTIWMILQQH